MTVQVRKATAQEKSAYLQTAPLYPLSHWVRVGDRTCAVEFPNEDHGPKYEVMAPKGFHFSEVETTESLCAESLHTVLAVDLKDLKDRLNHMTLLPCPEEE